MNTEHLLAKAILAMSALHDSMTPDEHEVNAIVPPAALRAFVDAHAQIVYERQQSETNHVTFDLVSHLQRQREFSLNTFGPGTRAAGVVGHIRKELAEIEAAPGDLYEWVDVVLLALDGSWRAGFEPGEISFAIAHKQILNEARAWPDWRTAEPGKAIQHVRSEVVEVKTEVALSTTSREQQLEHALRELVAAIDLATDCMDGSIQSSMLDLYIENAEALLEENKTANLGLPPVGAGVVGYFVGTWIDASKELPDSDTTVFVSLINDPEPVWLGYHDGTTWLSVEGAEIEVISWSDLPERAMRPVKEVEFHEG